MRRLLNIINGVFTLISRFKGFSNTPGPKQFYLKLDSNPYDRHLYIFLKCLTKAGYVINIYPNRKFLIETIRDTYAKLIFQEDKVQLTFFRGNTRIETNGAFKPIEISSYPYEALLKDEKIEGILFPIGMHPLRYFRNYDLKERFENEKINSTITIGNISNTYDHDLLKNRFQMENRYQLIQFLSKRKNFFNPVSLAEFNSSSKGNKLVVVSTQDFGFKLTKFRKTLAEFTFFLAIPGFYKPLCHNLIEAISVNCIPILHINYAKLYNGIFVHNQNCIIYNDLEDLDHKLSSIENLSLESIAAYQKNLRTTYKTKFNYGLIVEQIENSNTNKILLPAN